MNKDKWGLASTAVGVVISISATTLLFITGEIVFSLPLLAGTGLIILGTALVNIGIDK